MNIWIYNHYAVGPNSNGITRHFDLAKYLIKKGHNVTIFASSFNHQALKEEHLKDSSEKYTEKDYEGVKFVWLKTFPYQNNNWRRVINMLNYTIKAYLYGEKRKDNPDIVLGSLAHPLAAYVGYLIAKRKKALFYFEERDLWPQSLIDLGKMSPKNPAIIVLSRLEKYLYKNSQRIILLFDKAINYVESRGITKNKVVYLPNGVDFTRFDKITELPKDITKKLSDLEDKIIVAYTGTLGLANNIDTVLDAAKLIMNANPQVHFIFVGGGPQKQHLIKRKEKEKIDNVTFFDPLPKEYIPVILKKTNIGLLPLKESPVFKWGISPNKLYDYMAASLPVLLMCDLDDTPVEKYKAGKVFKKEFVHNLVNFLRNVNLEELHIMGENGYKYVHENHDWELLANNLERIMLEDAEKLVK
ncbi:glycosyltransferase family 4 protein [Oceanobacillus damuensis]|uniref:glycosyltransferase family 4 protein n=1 Tax=Oceanobacillus damuensis TaxID=937928 RepID=UPI0008378CA8|nr:glycosyltransferase family 4 protein [Oceanobacillus damuensis]